MSRMHVPTSAPWAATVGYSRALRVGNHVFVAGTAAVAADGSIVGVGDPYRQAQRCFEIIVQALRDAGASVNDVVRTRMFVRDPKDWEAIGRAHGEVFAHVKPVTTMVFTDFIDPEMLVEIEADAIIGG